MKTPDHKNRDDGTRKMICPECGSSKLKREKITYLYDGHIEELVCKKCGCEIVDVVC